MPYSLWGFTSTVKLTKTLHIFLPFPRRNLPSWNGPRDPLHLSFDFSLIMPWYAEQVQCLDCCFVCVLFFFFFPPLWKGEKRSKNVVNMLLIPNISKVVVDCFCSLIYLSVLITSSQRSITWLDMQISQCEYESNQCIWRPSLWCLGV